jgi:hypothetical protein
MHGFRVLRLPVFFLRWTRVPYARRAPLAVAPDDAVVYVVDLDAVNAEVGRRPIQTRHRIEPPVNSRRRLRTRRSRRASRWPPNAKGSEVRALVRKQCASGAGNISTENRGLPSTRMRNEGARAEAEHDARKYFGSGRLGLGRILGYRCAPLALRNDIKRRSSRPRT